jgi:hypothetical protein
VNNPEDKKDKLHALSLAKDCYSMKLELLTNATVIEDALKFVSANKDNKVVLANNKPLNIDEIIPKETIEKTVF